VSLLPVTGFAPCFNLDWDTAGKYCTKMKANSIQQRGPDGSSTPQMLLCLVAEVKLKFVSSIRSRVLNIQLMKCLKTRSCLCLGVVRCQHLKAPLTA